jgi:Rod binding domain-containing protein
MTPIITPSSITPSSSSALDAGKVKATAKEFEAVFVSEMLSHMFEGIEVDKEFGGGAGETMFRSMMVQEYGKQMTKGGGLGISDQIQKMMIQMQQQQQ